MGRYPFLTKVKECIAEWKPYYSPHTIWERKRKLRMIGRELSRLRAAGRVDTTDPMKLGEREIGALLTAWKDRELDPTTQHSYLRVLSYFLRWCGNTVIDKMRQRKVNLPKEIRGKEQVALTMGELERIWATCESVEGWQGEVARFIFRAYPMTGLRNKELRLAHFEDLDTVKWTLRVRHPKGEGSWGRERVTAIPPPLRAPVLDFLRAREEWVKSQGFEHADPLIPSWATRKTGYKLGCYTHNGFEQLKLDVERACGVRFKIKDLRSTCAQLLKDMGVGIEAVSKQLGHASTVTTERFYARIRDEAAIRQINDAWELALSRAKTKTAN